jgi:hypothetical protein
MNSGTVGSSVNAFRFSHDIFNSGVKWLGV